jgi:hypothetical protein
MTTTYKSYDFPESGSPEYGVMRWIRRGLLRRWQDSVERPREIQQDRLHKILATARGSSFAKEHGLGTVRTFADFRSAIPVRSHEGFRPWLDRVADGEKRVLVREQTLALMETSGTTGPPKLIPVTKSWARSISDAQALWVLAMLRDHPRVGQGKSLTVVSPAVHARSRGGLPIGSNTGRMHQAQSWLVKRTFAVPYEVFQIKSPELRQYAILRFALQEPVSSWTTANPSMVLLLCRRLKEWRDELSWDLLHGTLCCGPARQLPEEQRRRLEVGLRKTAPPSEWLPARIWPLDVVNCWRGGPARYFAAQLPRALGGDVPIREVGVTASEGYFALPMGLDWGGGVLWTLGHLLEFIDDAGGIHWSWELEVGSSYRMIITTESGLFRYDLGDRIEVVAHCGRTPVIRFVGKAGRFLNAVGEKVSEEQISAAVQQASEATGFHPVGFTARLLWSEIPWIELSVEGLAPAGFIGVFDTALGQHNIEYAGKRESGRMSVAKLRPLRAGTYARYRRDRAIQGAPAGQIKDPVIALGNEEWERILAAEGP